MSVLSVLGSVRASSEPATFVWTSLPPWSGVYESPAVEDENYQRSKRGNGYQDLGSTGQGWSRNSFGYHTSLPPGVSTPEVLTATLPSCTPGKERGRD